MPGVMELQIKVLVAVLADLGIIEVVAVAALVQ
jgi:hypothetical protein